MTEIAYVDQSMKVLCSSQTTPGVPTAEGVVYAEDISDRPSTDT